MKSLIVWLSALMVMLPLAAWANDAPGSTGSGSPEPLALGLLLAGAVPAAILARRKKRTG